MNIRLIYFYVILNTLIVFEYTISKGRWSVGSNDSDLTENSSSIVNTSGSFANKSSTASDVLFP